MEFLQDQLDLSSAFHAHGVRFIILGGHAVNIYTEPRYTSDLDGLVSGDEANGRAVYRSLDTFGAPLAGVTAEDFINKPSQFLQVGVPPARVDILQSIPAVSFEDAWENATLVRVGELQLRFLSREDLLRNKLAAGRARDLADVEQLRKFSEGIR